MSPQNKLRNNYLRICIKHHTQCFDVIFDMSGDQKLHCFCDNFDMKWVSYLQKNPHTAWVVRAVSAY